jgi:ABC-type lipoprotein export system ATPase subunit
MFKRVDLPLPLFPYLTAVENIELPMIINGKAKRGRALELLELVGMGHRKNSRLGQLSGGEQQRIAIAIALANNPKLLLADEPTGAVDTKTASLILDVFRELNKSLDLTIVIVTHDRQLSRKVNRVVAIRDGRTSSEFIRKKSYEEELGEIAAGNNVNHEEETHQELAVMDRAGRLQIPKEYIEAMGLKDKNKIKVLLEGNHVILCSPEDNGDVNAGQ